MRNFFLYSVHCKVLVKHRISIILFYPFFYVRIKTGRNFYIPCTLQGISEVQNFHYFISLFFIIIIISVGGLKPGGIFIYCIYQLKGTRNIPTNALHIILRRPSATVTYPHPEGQRSSHSYPKLMRFHIVSYFTINIKTKNNEGENAAAV